MEVARGVHGVSPLCIDHSDRCKVGFNRRGRSTRMKTRVVNQQGSLLDGSVGNSTEGRNLMCRNAKFFKGCQSSFRHDSCKLQAFYSIFPPVGCNYYVRHCDWALGESCSTIACGHVPRHRRHTLIVIAIISIKPPDRLLQAKSDEWSGMESP